MSKLKTIKTETPINHSTMRVPLLLQEKSELPGNLEGLCLYRISGRAAHIIGGKIAVPGIPHAISESRRLP